MTSNAGRRLMPYPPSWRQIDGLLWLGGGQILNAALQLYVAHIAGLAFSGELAALAGVAVIITIITTGRMDVQLLASPTREVKRVFSQGLAYAGGVSSLLVLGWVLVRALLDIGDQHARIGALVYSAVFTACTEISCTYLIKMRRYVMHLIVRCVGACAVLFLVIGIGVAQPAHVWMIGCMVTGVLAAVVALPSVKDFGDMALPTLSDIRNLVARNGVQSVAVLSYPLAANIWILALSYSLGVFEAGLVANMQRVYGLPITLGLAILTPILLGRLGDVDAKEHIDFTLAGWRKVVWIVPFSIIGILFEDGRLVGLVALTPSEMVSGWLCALVFVHAALKGLFAILLGPLQTMRRMSLPLSLLILEILIACVLGISGACTNISCYLYAMVVIAGISCFAVIRLVK